MARVQAKRLLNQGIVEMLHRTIKDRLVNQHIMENCSCCFILLFIWKMAHDVFYYESRKLCKYDSWWPWGRKFTLTTLTFFSIIQFNSAGKWNRLKGKSGRRGYLWSDSEWFIYHLSASNWPDNNVGDLIKRALKYECMHYE